MNIRRMLIGGVVLCGLAGGVCLGDDTAAPADNNGAATTAPSNAAIDAMTPQTPGYPRFVRFRQVLTTLGLSDDQQSQVNVLFNTLAGDLENLSIAPDATAPQKQAQVTPLFQKMRKQLAGILTPDQLTAFNQALQAPAGRAGAGKGAGAAAGGANTNAGGANAANPNAVAPGAGNGAQLQALRAAIPQLNLTSDQQQQIVQLLRDAQAKALQLRQQAAAGNDVQADLAQNKADVQAKLQKILTPDQFSKLVSLMQQGGANNPNGAGNGAGTAKPDMASSDGMMDGAATQPSVGMKNPSEWDGVIKPGVQAGDAAPDFSLKTLDGHAVQLDNFKGRVLVMEFGSVSSPTFRNQVAAMEKLKAAEGNRVSFLLVYTREVYPSDAPAVPQNIADNISVAQPGDMRGRIALATRARDALRISLPVAVDSMDDKVADAYGGFPNGAVVIMDGTVAARLRWTNVDTLQSAIQQALRN